MMSLVSRCGGRLVVLTEFRSVRHIEASPTSSRTGCTCSKKYKPSVHAVNTPLGLRIDARRPARFIRDPDSNYKLIAGKTPLISALAACSACLYVWYGWPWRLSVQRITESHETSGSAHSTCSSWCIWERSSHLLHAIRRRTSMSPGLPQPESIFFVLHFPDNASGWTPRTNTGWFVRR